MTRRRSRHLFVTATIDLASDRVLEYLESCGAGVFRLNTDRLLHEIEATFDGSRFVLRDGLREMSSSDVQSVWFRRLRVAACPDDVEPEIHAYVSRESHAVVRSALDTLGAEVRWVSAPAAIEQAERKPYQLHVARSLGLRTPRTLITSNPLEIKSFVESAAGENVIGKSVRSGFLRASSGDLAIYTRRISRADVAGVQDALRCPLILQIEEPKRSDIRVTIVGETIFAAEIHSQEDPDAVVDWRRTSNPNLRHSRHQLPHEIEDKCRRLMRALGLAYGALDFVLRADGEYVFLEVNPNGEWLWIEDKLGYPISEAVGDLLLSRGSGDA